ncbi:beta-1,3-galactosyltransferase 2-like [Gastrophryne carolinensis]
MCQYVQQTKMITLGEFPPIELKHFINCKSVNIIYALTCTCERFYIGKTNRELRKRIYEHTYDIKTGNRKTPLKTKHFVSHCIIIVGFATLAFFVFMLLNLKDPTLFSKSIHHTENHSLRIFNLKSFRSQKTNASQQAAAVTTPYKYLLNEPKKCLTSNPFLILLILVQAWQKEARQAIRQTWGKEDFLPGVKVLRLFLLGKEGVRNERVEQYITEESRQYHDIIQQDFLDTYYNLTLKTLMGLHWVATYCPHALYVMKTDSDMFINTEYLVYKVLKPDQPPRTNYFTGYLMRGYSPNRNKESKWYISEDLYPGDQYPSFCSGTGYVFSGDLVVKILNISPNITMLHLEDVFVGLCLNKIGVSPVPPPKDSDFNHWKIFYSPCVYNSLVTTHHHEPFEIIRNWNDLQHNKNLCVR